MFDVELDVFKTKIDLRSYAAGLGYHLDRKESWAGSAVMRHPGTGDKVVIKQSHDNHYVYFSVRDDRDNGTIIDFIQRRKGIKLGEVRKELRHWVVAPVRVAQPSFAPLRKTARDRMKVESEFAKMLDAWEHPYLENQRSIPKKLLQSERFDGRIRIDRRGNAVFPHYDADGLCGFEMKNVGFTSFSPGGSKGMWQSHELPGDSWLVICESSIDALSHAALYPNAEARYASIGGKPSPAQSELVRSTLASLPQRYSVVAAMDADVAGAKLVEMVHEAFKMTGRLDLYWQSQVPVGFKDWNDQLRAELEA